MNARTCIRRFDAIYDVAFKHNECLDALRKLGAFNHPKLDDLESLAVFVGAHWCRIVAADVHYDLPTGLEYAARSEEKATELIEMVERRECAGDEAETFAAYVTARWNDGVAKIRFRCGYFAEARLRFERAIQIANEYRLWWCYPDLASNYIRAEFDELKNWLSREEVAVQASQRCADLKTIFADQKAVASEHGVEIVVPANPGDANEIHYEAREFLRGLSSLLHNASVLEGDPDETLSLSRQSEEICRALGDQYRLGQALREQAKIAQQKGEISLAIEQYTTLATTTQWERGKLIGKQHSAKLRGTWQESSESEREQAWSDLLSLLKELKSNAHARDGVVIDAESHFFMVDSLESVFCAIRERAGGGVSEKLQVLRREQIEMLESVRQSVETFMYKEEFSKRNYPVFMEIIGEKLEEMFDGRFGEPDLSTRGDELFSLVEQANCRTLLDVMASRKANPN